ncbi:MAG: hypothetical protein QXJ75_05070 [Candidatus Bathyarchaeia archaeon]
MKHMEGLTPAIALALIIPAVSGFIVVDRLTNPIGNFMKSRGIVGVDVHKLDKTVIPEMCGLVIILGVTTSAGLLCWFLPKYWSKFLALILVVAIAAVVGYIDYLSHWRAKVKVAACAAACIPILLTPGTYVSHPSAPFIGELRLTILYPLILVPVFTTLMANAANMIDVLNGAMPITSAIAGIFLFLTALLFGRLEAAAMYLSLVACLLAYYRFNRYPAKVFTGDIGSLGVGAAFGAIAVMGGLEILTLIAFLPAMINGSLNLSSVGRLFERREISQRPIVLLPDGRLSASQMREAPITLTRLLLASGPLRESEIVRRFMVLATFAGVLEMLTAVLMVL